MLDRSEVLVPTDDTVSVVRVSWLRQILRRLLSNPSAIVGIFLMGLVIVLAVVAPLIGTTNPDTFDLNALNTDPSSAHWFGTDYLGRDMWSRVVYGGRVSLPPGLGVITIALGVRTPIGLVAGYIRAFLDDLLTRSIDLPLCSPPLL